LTNAAVYEDSRRDPHEPARARHSQRTGQAGATAWRANAICRRSTSSPTTSSADSRRFGPRRSKICAVAAPRSRAAPAIRPALLEAVARGEAIPEADLPERSRRPLGISRDTFAALMSVVVGKSPGERDAGGAARPRSALERVARELPQTHEELQAALGSPPGAGSCWSTLERLLSGGATLAIEGYADGDPKYVCPWIHERIATMPPPRSAWATAPMPTTVSMRSNAPAYQTRTPAVSLKILLENLLRFEDGRSVTAADVEALARWKPGGSRIARSVPSRARAAARLHGVPCVVDLRRCATRWPRWAATRAASTRCSPSSS